MNIPNNARSTASKTSIKEAFVQLLGSKKPDAITVQEICMTAKVNRTTFYAHFSNVRDLLEAMEADLYYDAEDRLLPKTSDVTLLISRETMLRILNYMRKNEALYRAYFSELTKSKLVAELIDSVSKTYIMPALKRSKAFDASEYEYQYEFCKAGTLSVIKKWLTTGCKEWEKDVAGLIEKMLKRCLP
jgi:AcrR family transcriptional regulator